MKRTFTLLAAAFATTAAAQKPYHRDLAVLEVNREAPRTEFVEFASRDEALTRSFEPLSRSIWYSPAPSHSSMTSTRKCRMVWAVLECFIPSRQSRGFCI